MKKILLTLSVLAITAAAVLSAGCNMDLKTFTYSWNELTDGETVYKRLPTGWEYHGEFKNLIGTVDSGNMLYASEDGLFVREQRNLLQDMDYAPFMRGDLELPEVSPENCSVVIALKTGETLYLSAPAKEEFFSLRGELLSGKDPKKPDSCFIYLARTYLAVPGIADLRFNDGFMIYETDDGLLLLDSRGYAAEIDADSALHREIARKNEE